MVDRVRKQFNIVSGAGLCYGGRLIDAGPWGTLHVPCNDQTTVTVLKQPQALARVLRAIRVANSSPVGRILTVESEVRLVDSILYRLRLFLIRERCVIVVAVDVLSRETSLTVPKATDLVSFDRTTGDAHLDPGVRRVIAHFDCTRVVPVVLICTNPTCMDLFVNKLPWASADPARCSSSAVSGV